MKSISEPFGFWTLMIGAFGSIMADQFIAASVLFVGAMLFHAIKTSSPDIVIGLPMSQFMKEKLDEERNKQS